MYTRGGDKGETGLYGAKRVAKDSLRVDAYGTIDELNCWIGVAVANCDHEEVAKPLVQLQSLLFTAGADLATDVGSAGKVPRIGGGDVKDLERKIDVLHKELPKLTTFILPGGTRLSSSIQVARAVCRRAERRAVALSHEEEINPEMVPFLNRLSTYLFNLARYANALDGVKEQAWKPG